MTAKHYGGMGGIAGGRELDSGNAFEKTINEVMGDVIRTDDDVATALWCALSNVDWYHPESGSSASYSFRAAGDLIAAIRGSGNYMDWYCSGQDGVVTDFIARTMKKVGWIADTMGSICDVPGCLEFVSCGWPSPSGYRATCGKHMREGKKKGPVAGSVPALDC